MLPSEIPWVLHTGNGTRGPFSLAVDGVPITYADKAHIRVTRYASDGTDTLLVDGTHYDLSALAALPDLGDPERPVATASLTLKLAQTVLAVDEYLLIERVAPASQDLMFTQNGGFSSKSVESTFDAVMRVIQQIVNTLSRGVTINALDSSGSLELPRAEDRAGKFFTFDEDGNPSTASPEIGLGDLLSSNNLSDLDSIVTARANLELGSAALLDEGDVFQVASNLSEGVPSTMRANLAVYSTTQVDTLIGTSARTSRYGTNDAALALAKISAGVGGTVIIDNAVVLTSTATLDGYMTRFEGGTIAPPAASATLTMGAIHSSPFSQIFVGANIARVRFASAMEVYAAWFGQVADGVTDDAAAISAAFSALPADGGEVIVDGPVFAIGSPIIMGDGTNVSLSTKCGMTLRASTYVSGVTIGEFGPPTSGVRALWIGADSTTAAMLDIRGPIHSGRVLGILFDCAGLAGIGIKARNHFNWSFEGTRVTRYTTLAWDIQSYDAALPSGVAVGTANNTYYQCGCFTPWDSGAFAQGASALRLWGGPNFNIAMSRQIFIGGDWHYGGNANTFGVELYFADNNLFQGVHFARVGGGTSGDDVRLVKNTTGYYQGLFPLENTFVQCPGVSGYAVYDDTGAAIAAGSGGIGSNLVLGASTADGAAFPAHEGITAFGHDGLLSNLRVRDDRFKIIDNSDNSKIVQLQLSGLTTATTRVLSVPDFDFTMVGETSGGLVVSRGLSGDDSGFAQIVAGLTMFSLTRETNGVKLSSYDDIEFWTGATGGVGTGTVRAVMTDTEFTLSIPVLAPTAAPGTNTTQVATTGFVKAAIDVVLGGVSSAFDTLSEIATAIGALVSDTAYDSTSWNGVSTVAPSKNAMRDWIVSLFVDVHTWNGLQTFESDISLTVGADQYLYYDGALHITKNGTGNAIDIDSSRNVSLTGALTVGGAATFNQSIKTSPNVSVYALQSGRYNSGYTGAVMNGVDVTGGSNHPTFWEWQIQGSPAFRVTAAGVITVGAALANTVLTDATGARLGAANIFAPGSLANAFARSDDNPHQFELRSSGSTVRSYWGANSSYGLAVYNAAFSHSLVWVNATGNLLSSGDIQSATALRYLNGTHNAFIGSNGSIPALGVISAHDLGFYVGGATRMTLSQTGVLTLGSDTVVTNSSTVGAATVDDGTWTPTLTNVANCAVLTAYPGQYQRVGNTVTCSVTVGVDPTTAPLITTFRLSLPVASNIGSVIHAGGVGACAAPWTNTGPAVVTGDAANNEVQVDLFPGSDTDQLWYLHFTYQVI